MFLRAFASTCLKFSIYFSTRTYFFLFYAITFQKHLHQIMYYTFCLFKLLLLFSFSFTLSLSQISKDSKQYSLTSLLCLSSLSLKRMLSLLTSPPLLLCCCLFFFWVWWFIWICIWVWRVWDLDLMNLMICIDLMNLQSILLGLKRR